MKVAMRRTCHHGHEPDVHQQPEGRSDDEGRQQLRVACTVDGEHTEVDREDGKHAEMSADANGE